MSASSFQLGMFRLVQASTFRHSASEESRRKTRQPYVSEALPCFAPCNQHANQIEFMPKESSSLQSSPRRTSNHHYHALLTPFPSTLSLKLPSTRLAASHMHCTLLLRINQNTARINQLGCVRMMLMISNKPVHHSAYESTSPV